MPSHLAAPGGGRADDEFGQRGSDGEDRDRGNRGPDLEQLRKARKEEHRALCGDADGRRACDEHERVTRGEGSPLRPPGEGTPFAAAQEIDHIGDAGHEEKHRLDSIDGSTIITSPRRMTVPRRKCWSIRMYASPRVKARGADTATTPMTRSGFELLEPSTRPLTISDTPPRTANTPATSSGSDVPTATMSTPMTKGERPNPRPTRSAAPVKTRAAVSRTARLRTNASTMSSGFTTRPRKS
jgi:hypothetical protein